MNKLSRNSISSELRRPSLVRSLAMGLSSLLLMPALAHGQQEGLKQRFGVYGNFGFNIHQADLEGLPGILTCAPPYRFGSGTGPALGLAYERDLFGDFDMAFRIGYLSRNATLAVDEPQVVEIEGAATPIAIEHRIDASLISVAFAPAIRWHLSKALSISAGPEVGYVLSTAYSQVERLSDDERRGRFSNGMRVRNESSGAVPDAAQFHAAIQLGLSYDLLLNTAATFIAMPEVTASYGLTPVIGGKSWSAHAIRFGVAIQYAPTTARPAPIASQPVLVPASLSASISAMDLDENDHEDSVATIRVEELITSVVRPVLPYLFFDNDSASIPGKYHAMTSEMSVQYSLDSIRDDHPLAIHYEVLNIVGSRLREHPSARLRIVGTNANVGSEEGNRLLSKQRAEAVMSYLVTSWGVERTRIRVEAVDQPAIPSSPIVQDGIEENRRVELYSDDPAILAPVRTTDTLRTTTPPSLRFHTAVNAAAGVESWSMTVTQNGERLAYFAEIGPVPATLDWRLTRDQPSVPRLTGSIEYTLSIVDSNGREYRTEQQSIPIEQITIRNKRRKEFADAGVERYSQILFEYDRSEVTPTHRAIIDDIRKRIGPTSRVKVTGFTDRIGDADHNRRLALDRAAAVSQALQLPDKQIEIRGETLPPSDQSTPEGRFHSRRVEIEIKTPLGDNG